MLQKYGKPFKNLLFKNIILFLFGSHDFPLFV